VSTLTGVTCSASKQDSSTLPVSPQQGEGGSRAEQARVLRGSQPR
jgi:hypothetical protein